MQHLKKRILRYADRQGLSDVHVHVGVPPALRVDGKITVLDESIVSLPEFRHFADRCLTAELLKQWHDDKCLDTDIECEGRRFRANFYFESGNPAVVLRRIRDEIPTLEELGFPDGIRRFLSSGQGLILVTGATGSGKSTSLAAMVDDLLSASSIHVITIEDPVEFRFKLRGSVVSQRQIGVDAHDFTSALYAALREDPDVILIGEMRDTATIELALMAAELGHLVMGTLHASDCVGAVARIVDAFPASSRDCTRTQLAAGLRLVISQRLLARRDQPGRVAAFEVLVATQAVRNLIRENKIVHLASVIETSQSEGMITMAASVQKLYAEGRIHAV